MSPPNRNHSSSDAPEATAAGGSRNGVLSLPLAIIKYPVTLLRRLYDWTIHWARTKQAPYALGAVAFVESSFFPIPPDPLLIAMVVSERKKWIRNALICTFGSVFGALLGYYIGKEFYDLVGVKVVDFYNLHHKMEFIRQRFEANALPTVLTAAFTPIPFKVITIGAGLFGVSLPLLVIGSIVGRAGRFFLVAGLLRIFGERISVFIEKYFDVLSLVFAALLIGGFVIIKYFI